MGLRVTVDVSIFMMISIIVSQPCALALGCARSVDHQVPLWRQHVLVGVPDPDRVLVLVQECTSRLSECWLSHRTYIYHADTVRLASVQGALLVLGLHRDLSLVLWTVCWRGGLLEGAVLPALSCRSGDVPVWCLLLKVLFN